MQIVQLANFYGPRSGGIRTALRELGRRYVEAGHRCTRIVPADADGVSTIDGVTEIAVRAPVVPASGGYRVITRVGDVAALVDDIAPDVVELSDKTTLVKVAQQQRRRGAFVVAFSHERVDAVVGHTMHWRAAGRLASAVCERRLDEATDLIIGASNFALGEYSDGVSTAHVPLGVDLDLFRPDPGHRRSGTLRIITVVRQSPEKSPHLVVDAARELHRREIDFRWDVFGDGPLRRRLTNRAPVGVCFHGHTNDRHGLAQMMRSADVGVAPGPNETFGLAALELLASGTPVVVPDSGALPEVVTPAIGRVASIDGVAFADAIEAVAALPDTARRTARWVAEQYRWDDTVAQMLRRFGARRQEPLPLGRW